ncbi:MAG: phosphate ABC transporter substrate-binding protein [Thiohalomonadales bacterium]
MRISQYKNFWFNVFLFTSLCFSNTVLADVVVIVNPANDHSLTKVSKIKKYFLRKKKKFSNGQAVIPVVPPVGSKEREIFNEKVLHRSASQLKAYWSRIIFSGKGSPPKALSDAAAVKAFVAKNTRAIGYIDSSLADDSVKIIYTIK